MLSLACVLKASYTLMCSGSVWNRKNNFSLSNIPSPLLMMEQYIIWSVVTHILSLVSSYKNIPSSHTRIGGLYLTIVTTFQNRQGAELSNIDVISRYTGLSVASICACPWVEFLGFLLGLLGQKGPERSSDLSQQRRTQVKKFKPCKAEAILTHWLPIILSGPL